MITLLIINILCYLILFGILTFMLLMYLKQVKETEKQKRHYEEKIDYYINELKNRNKGD